MKRSVGVLDVFLMAVFLCVGCSSDPNGSNGTTNPGVWEPEIQLHEKWPFMVGAAAPRNAFDPSNGQYKLLGQFNVLVAENDMKPESIMPSSESGAYNWTNADKLVNNAEANNTKIRGHVLIWHNQTPSWFTSGNNKEQLYARMEKHIKTVFEHYGGRIEWWDVCNEVIDGSEENGYGPRNSRYTQIMEASGLKGMDRYEYVVKAFQWARKYADENGGQNVKLILNEWSAERLPGKFAAFKELVEYLIEKGTPIDGVGFQTHIRTNWDYIPIFFDNIDTITSLKKKDDTNIVAQITELDISIFHENSEGPRLSQSLLDERLDKQAVMYREIFNSAKERFEVGKLDMVVLWGLADGESWLNDDPVRGRTNHPLLFDRSYLPKKAYDVLVE